MPWTDDASFFLPSPPISSFSQFKQVRMTDPESKAPDTIGPSPPPPTPGSRRSARPSSFAQPMSLTPLVQSVSARVMADAEHKLSTLQSQVDALKAREELRESGLIPRNSGHLARPASAPGAHAQMFTAYPDFHEAADYGDVLCEAERKRMKQELESHYTIRREQMFKQMQLAFRQKQLELEQRAPNEKRKYRKNKKGKGKKEKNGFRYWNDSYRSPRVDIESNSEDDSEDESDEESEDNWKQAVTSPWNHNTSFDELRAARAKVDVVVCTTEHVPGFRLVEKLGTFKVVVPRSLLCYDDSPEELQNALELSKMVRQEAIDKAVGQARRRKANAIIDFKFKTELSQNINDDNVVLITATGKCCIVRRMLSDREQLMRRQMEDSRKRYRREKDVSILRAVLDKTKHAAERQAQARALSQMDERDLRAFLDEIQGKRKAEKASARQKADPHKDLLEQLLGQKVQFDRNPYAGGGRPGPPGRGKEASAAMVQELLMNLLGTRGAPATGPPAAARDDWEAKVTDDDAKSKDEAEAWEAYDL